MRLLLDTHALLWWLADDPRLGPSARLAIADPENEVFVSAATIWEVGIKRRQGKLTAPGELPAVIADEGFVEIPITGIDAEAAAALPAHHRDPFDRMLIAQSVRHGATIITRDDIFVRYGVAILEA